MSIPVVFTVPEMVEYFMAQVWVPTADEIETAGARLGRNAYPVLVADLHAEGLLLPDVAAVVVPAAWSLVEFPNRTLSADLWRALFDLAGYTVEGVPASRPSEPLQLWRGALHEWRAGWSWTDDRDLAQWFADRPHNAGRGQVWTADVEPARLLARISEQRAGESEYVVDARGLEILAEKPMSTDATGLAVRAEADRLRRITAERDAREREKDCTAASASVQG